MPSSSLLLLLFFVFLSSVQFLQSLSTVTLPLGLQDGFRDDVNNREYAPRSAKIQTCSLFDWRGVNGYNGDQQPAQMPWFDNSWTNSPLVATIANLPTGTVLQNARLEFSIKALDSWYSWNDGLGIIFDSNINKRWGWEDDDDENTQKICKVQYFIPFTSFAPTYGDYAGQVVNITWNIGNTTLYGTNTRIIDMIAQTGSFNVLWGDDTAVDYAKFYYDTGASGLNITTYSCRPYSTASGLGVGKQIYSDSTTCKVSTLVDSKIYSFNNAVFLQTHSQDAGSTDSCFHHRIEAATRYWLFVPQELTLPWLSAGAWAPLETGCGITATTGQNYKVYTKRYEGGRNVVFGPSCASKTDNKPMYFVATAPDIATAPPVSNPAANCLCSSTGDPHYVTFDSRKFDFYQPGVYHLVKARDCSFSVQTYTFKYGSTVTVNGVIGIRFFNDTVVFARQNTTAGQLWTGYPKAYVNGVFVNASTTVGGMVVTKVSNDEWKVFIADRNFTLRAVEAGSWFHVYANLGDLSYQRTVDGLCGNCDSKGSNDFKYPNCQNAIAKLDVSLSASDVAQWGLSWAASDSESFTGPDRNTKSLGVTSYASCLAAPLSPICPDLILTQGDGVVECAPPPTFYACNGSTPIPVVNTTIPTPINVTDIKPCSSSPNFTAILNKCKQCFNLTGYNPDHCMTDLCYGPESITTYTCPTPDGGNCPVGVVNGTFHYGGYTWASLGNGTGSPGSVGQNNCISAFSIPPGWQLAPDGDVSEDVIEMNSWGCSCMVVDGGRSYPTSQVKGFNPCFSAGHVQTGQCFTPNRCDTRILIRKPDNTSCSNAIRETGEDCDDGNLKAGDGCSATCKLEPGWSCYPSGKGDVCYPTDDVVGDNPTFTCKMPSNICSPCPYSAALATSKSCCVCSTPCC